MIKSARQLAKSLPLPPNDVWIEGVPFIKALSHGSMTTELFVPNAVDRQTPHDQDELYFVIGGHAVFNRDGAPPTEVSAGDAILVPARQSHSFSSISSDFITWVVFWGPTGGEQPIK